MAGREVGPQARDQWRFSKSAILHRFPKFYIVRVKISRMFLSVHVYIWPLWTMKSFMEIGPHVFQKPEDTHTHRRDNFIYMKENLHLQCSIINQTFRVALEFVSLKYCIPTWIIYDDLFMCVSTSNKRRWWWWIDDDAISKGAFRQDAAPRASCLNAPYFSQRHWFHSYWGPVFPPQINRSLSLMGD